jgi:hypothetical protein
MIRSLALALLLAAPAVPVTPAQVEAALVAWFGADHWRNLAHKAGRREAMRRTLEAAARA